jgi:hypothetical protein
VADYDDERPDFDDVFGDEPPREPRPRRGRLHGIRDRMARAGRRDEEPSPEEDDFDLDTGETGRFSRSRMRAGGPEDEAVEDDTTVFASAEDDFGFEDDVDERPVSRPRRGSSRRRARVGGGGRRRRPPGGGGTAALQQPAMRLLLGLAFLAILIVVITFVVRECQRSALEDSYRSYMNNVAGLVGESAQQGQALRQALNNPGGAEPDQVRGQVQEIAGQAQGLVDRAGDLDPPDALSGEQQSLVLALEYRVSGLTALGAGLPEIVASDDEAFAAQRIAENMQLLLASDVIYRSSFVEPARQAQEDDDITGIEVPEGEPFLPQAALATVEGAQTVLTGLKRGGGGGGGATDPDAGADGSLRGLSISAVTAGDTELVQGTATTVQFETFDSWSVTVENGGEFNENNIVVRAELAYSEGPPASAETEITEILQGEVQTVDVPIPEPEFFQYGEEGTLTITVDTVPNETNPDNNTATYPITITV